jgi:hypothetical protein
MLKIAQLMLTFAASAALMACGGGSSSSSSAGGTPITPSYPTTAKYLGTWNSVCDTDYIEANGAAGSYVVTTLELTTNTSNTVGGNLKTKVYAFTDSTCSNLLATMTQALTITVDAVGTATGGSDKVTFVKQNSAISGNTVTITSGTNSIVYPNGRTLGETLKQLVLPKTTQLQIGKKGVLDSAGYPTSLDSSIYGFFTKQ